MYDEAAVCVLRCGNDRKLQPHAVMVGCGCIVEKKQQTVVVGWSSKPGHVRFVTSQPRLFVID